MAKLMIFICIALFVGAAVISASPAKSWNARTQAPSIGSGCGRHGDPCTGRNAVSCCSGTSCHPYAGRCQATITADDLQNARNNLRKTGIRLP